MDDLKPKSNSVCAWAVVKTLIFINVLGVFLTWAMFGG